jgi:3-deoxy-D-manno-octulosonic-acid transferase
MRPGDAQSWLPWDTPGAVRDFLDHFRPRIGVLMETEVWPNLVAQCKARGVPLVLANARLSDKSLQQALALSPLSMPAYAALAAVWAQTPADARRLRQTGAEVSGVFGNLKFDATPDVAQLAQGRSWRATGGRPVVMFASSREGEEATLLAAIRARGDVAAVQWLVVPRHPQRFDEVAALVQAHGFSLSRRSTWGEAPQAADVWLGDSLGEMALYYGLSDVALLGGSFAPLGGQNLIEAAACGCPVVMGPHTFNFADAADLAAQAGAAFRVGDEAAAVEVALGLAAAGAQHDAATAATQAFAVAHRGAVQHTADAVLALAGPVAKR